MPNATENEMTLADRLATLDDFGVDWAGRDAKGNYRLESTVFAVVDVPAPFFGQNVRDFDFNTAIEMAADADWNDSHDFGLCYIKPNSLRKMSDGHWYIDLSVDNARHPKVTTMLVDENDEPILDDNGEPQVRVSPRKESWIMVRLDQVKPVDHPLSTEYRQRDTRSKGLLAANAQSERIANGGSKGRGGRSKGKRKRLTPDQIASLMNS